MEITFQKGVVIFFGILLVVILIFLGVTMNSSKLSTPWPPVTSVCPDYWLDYPINVETGQPIPDYVSGSNCVGTTDVAGVGMNIGTIDILPAKKTVSKYTAGQNFTGKDDCSKKEWAANNGNISWDGISYGVNDPC